MLRTIGFRARGLSIGQAARRTGVKLETIRYYERIGMLTGPARTAAGHRVFSADDLRTLAFIHRARELGFPLADIRTLLALRAAGPACCSGTRVIALRHLACIRAKMANLARLVRLLEQATDQSSAEGAVCCSVMDLLEGGRDSTSPARAPVSSNDGKPLDVPLAGPI
jgi:MerR family transcriptional regulator, mercuric resistance operon regulatory protein